MTMTAGTPANSRATGSQMPPLMSQKVLKRAATFSEGSQPLQLANRRRSSLVSESSDARFAPPRPIDNDMEVLTSTKKPSVWYSSPLAFAILPAAAGLFFPNGTVLATDILLLALGSGFLNWCVKAPWDWYHAARQQQLRHVEQGDEGNDSSSTHGAVPPASPPTGEDLGEDPGHDQSNAQAEREARLMNRKLERTEIFALVACFLGPILGAYLLHQVRIKLLTRPAEGLVSNFNLTIFVMAAELRPVNHLIKMQTAQIVLLRRTVDRHTIYRPRPQGEFELARRLTAIEARLAEPVVNGDGVTPDLRATIQQTVQPQLDALNRAVRRYEQRHNIQARQTAARFADLETRLQDTLHLAAAAARTGQRPSIVTMAISRVVQLPIDAVHMGWGMLFYPWRTVISVYEVVRSERPQANGTVRTVKN